MQDTLTLRIYSLLFSKPLYTTAKRKNDRLRNDVLILGSEDAAVESFCAVYWCGQYAAGNQLHITVASPDAEDFRQMLSEELPGLSHFPNMAQLHFVETGDVRFPGALDALDFEKAPYDYIIIALGDTGMNHYGAELVRQKLLAAGNRDALLALIDEEEDCVYSLYDPETGSLCRKDCADSRQTLDRLAFNIDFTYSLEQDPRASKRQIRSSFDTDPGYGDPAYTAAVHIPYKLALCNGFTEDSEKDIQTLIDAIHTENELYNTLIAVEHRRWIAYLVTCGYRPPTRQELEEYAFLDGCDYRDEDRLLHPGMCACDLTGRHLDEKYPLWGAEEKQWEGLPELDKMSLLLHRIATERAEPFCENAEDYFAFLRKRKDHSCLKYYENLRLSVLKLCAGEENSVRLYQQALAEARTAAGRQRDRFVLQALNDLEADFRVVVFRNQKVDFFELDAIRVDRIPFCLWYGEKNKTVITFTKGVLTEDIVVPTLLSAEEAVFIGKDVEKTPYRPAVQEYFRDRGDNTRVTTLNFTHNGVEEVTAFLSELVEKCDSPIFNCVDCDDPHILMAVGFVAAQKGIPAVRYDDKKGVVPVLNPAPLGLKLIDESLSIDEFTRLMGGKYKNVYELVGSIADYDAFTDIFWTFSKERTRQTISRNGRPKVDSYSPWAELATFFQAAQTDVTYNFVGGGRVPPTGYRGYFHPEIYRSCGIGRLLQSLENYSVIRDFSQRKEDTLELVEFTYVDALLETVLQPFEARRTDDPAQYRECLTKKLRFNPAICVTVSGVRVEDMLIGAPAPDPEDDRWTKRGFVNALANRGMITQVRWSADNTRVSFHYKDENIQEIFRTHGKVFELIIYKGLKSSGLFDDVQTGVEISWETNIKSFDVLLQEQLAHSHFLGFSGLRREVMKLRSLQSQCSAMTATDNELDVVAMQGMHPVFISCKTGRNGNGTEWLNEIATLSHHFHAQPVLALLRDLDDAASNFLVTRARRLGVSIIGTETIADPVRWKKAIVALAEGEPVFGPDTKA